MQNKVTMQQIADEAGVSTATVSRVLSGNPMVSEATRARVAHLIEKYRFRPNSVARSLARQRSFMLGMMVQDIENPYFAAMYLQAERLAASRGYTLLTLSSLSFVNERESIQSLAERQVDGMLLVSASLDARPVMPEMLQLLRQLTEDTNLVLISEPVPGLEDGVFVTCDNDHGFALATRYLLSLGHQRIALIGGADDTNTTHSRYEAFRRTLAEHGLSAPPEAIQSMGYEPEGGERAMSRLLASGYRPTAVLTMNDMVALGAMKVLSQQGIQVPRDISLISCDQTYISRSVWPELTSIDIFPGLQGEKAVEALLDMIDGRAPRRVTCIAPELVIRGSTARPAE